MGRPRRTRFLVQVPDDGGCAGRESPQEEEKLSVKKGLKSERLVNGVTGCDVGREVRKQGSAKPSTLTLSMNDGSIIPLRSGSLSKRNVGSVAELGSGYSLLKSAFLRGKC